MQKGFAHLFVILFGILLIAGLVIGGSFYFKSKKKLVIPASIPQASFAPTPQSNLKEYENTSLGIKFEYPRDFEVKQDAEEAFHERSKGNFRKNFTSYIGYPPEKFVGALILLGSNKSFENSPFTLWVFENPSNLTIDAWYEKYWHYPFIWGDFTERRKAHAPINEMQVGGLPAKFGVVPYQPNSPKFIHVSYKDKEFLFKVINKPEGIAEKVLDSFKFLE